MNGNARDYDDSSGGVGNSGVLKLTTALNSQIGTFVIDDLNAGQPIGGFTASFKLRIGGGTSVPADGISFNFGPAINPGAIYSEEGGGGGLTVSFDTYDNGNEAPAIDVFWQGQLIARKWFAGVGPVWRELFREFFSQRRLLGGHCFRNNFPKPIGRQPGWLWSLVPESWRRRNLRGLRRLEPGFGRSISCGRLGSRRPSAIGPIPPEEILSAVAEVSRGGAPMSSHIARMVVTAFRQPIEKGATGDLQLSPREEEILRLLAKGYRSKEIADDLRIGAGTVNTHVRHIYEKLHVRSRAEAVAAFLR